MNKVINTAILVFTRTATEEATYKTYVRGGPVNDNVAVSSIFIEHTTAQATASGLDTYVIDSKHQQGISFGERLNNATRAILTKGYQQIIIVGTDTPGVTTSHINKVKNALDKGDNVVAGPSADGGVYIIGLKKYSYRSECILEVPWQTHNVRKFISEYAHSKKWKYSEIEVLKDLDSSTDFYQWLQTSNSSLVRVVKTLLESSSVKVAFSYNLSHHNYANSSIVLRGPPLVTI